MANGFYNGISDRQRDRAFLRVSASNEKQIKNLLLDS
jgi:hypothetical protein